MTTFNEHPEQGIPGITFGTDRPLTASEMTQYRAFGPLPVIEPGVDLDLTAQVQHRLAEYDLDTISYAPGFDYSQVEDETSDGATIEAAPSVETQPDYSQYFNHYHREFDY